MRLAAPLERLIEALRKLPGIGAKSAQRLAFHVLRGSRDDARALATALLEVKDTLRLCTLCFNVTDIDPCLICADANRDRSQVRATRIALGLPVGSELEYADEVTVGKALEGRREICCRAAAASSRGCSSESRSSRAPTTASCSWSRSSWSSCRCIWDRVCRSTA